MQVPCTEVQGRSIVVKTFSRISLRISWSMVDMVADIGKWLVIGLLIAGIITAIVPDSIFSTFKDNSLLQYTPQMLFPIGEASIPQTTVGCW